MTVSSTLSRQTFACDGTTQVFTLPFRVLAATEVVGYRITVSDSTAVELTNGVDFTVSGVGAANAVVTTAVALASTYQVRFIRSTQRLQLTDYRDNDPFPAESHEEALDRLTHIAQELDGITSRALTFPEPESGQSIPSVTGRAGKALGFDEDGNVVALELADSSGIVGTTFGSESQISTAGQTVFTLTGGSYAPGSDALRVFVDGWRMTRGVEYEETSSTVVTFLIPLIAGRRVTFDYGRTVTSGMRSDQVGHTPAAGVAGTVKQFLDREPLNVKNYGATGDGATNDTAAIQATIDACADAGGGIVYFPPGTYIVTSPLLCDEAVTLIRGAGVRATRLQVNHTSGPAIQLKYYFSGVEDMTIQGSSARLAAAAGTNYGIYFPTDSAIAQSRFANFVKRVIVNNHSSHGIYSTGQGMTIEDVRGIDIGGHGVYFDNFDADPNALAGFSEVKNSQFVRCTGHAVCAGVNRLTFRITLDNVDAYHCALTAGVRQSLHTFHMVTENLIVRSCGIGGWSGDSPSRVLAIGAIYVDGRSPSIKSSRFIDVAGPAITLGANCDGYDIGPDIQITGEVQIALDPVVEVTSGAVGGRAAWGFPANVTNAATLSASGSGNVSETYHIPMQGFRSNIARSAVADDSVKSWTFRAESGAAWGVALIGIGSSAAEAFLVAFRAGDGSAYCTLLSSASNVNTTTGVLAGTTGTDTKLTVSVSTSGTPTLYLENRRGSSIDVMPTFLSIGRGELGGVS